MTGRCLIGQARLPMRRRRISNLFAAGISNPKSCSIGPAVLTDIFPPSGHPIHPGLVSLPGSQSVLETPVAASLDAAPSLAGAPGGHVVERVGSDVTAIFLLSITKRDQLGGDLLRDGAQRLPGVGLLHSRRMERSNVRVVASAYVNARE